ncbi:MAG: hemolysin III family protein [Flavobacteriaceae bacterium]|jgi:hemolysin III|nr:hemolysin III family protein [Flavobacteriaceae bacterium]MBT4415998.1 hemolysin III family protein [Flavobacteriaceae bacterium]MBT5012055.1 hemolysin III family protein [Flavobacteriaceae bacterium]MBT5595622.1 hemolysin III family protein [Flavobacteriaceae bacterium]MBT5857051.1 hemolysin III family protein [Flavobacteriaceae bacterium]
MTETKEEEFWNTLTHFVGLIFSLIGLPVLLYSDQGLTELSVLSILFFEFGLICVYSASTLYHYTSNVELKKKFRVFDHVSIFYLIAGSYAPVCLITLYNGSGKTIFITILVIALIGTIFKVFFTGKFDKLFLMLYLAMGWLIVLDFNGILNALDYNGIVLLVTSGLFYSLGTLFYSLQKMKYSHAIWHLFVLGGSASHYFLVLFYII